MSVYSSRGVDPQKADVQLQLAIKKATSPIETSPKQKHVRRCIVYTWEVKSSRSFWLGMKNQPLYDDEVQAFKALITIHKVIRQGHPNVLKEAIEERGFLEQLHANIAYDNYRGYGEIISGYVDFLLAKLEYHRLHPEFTGSFNYEEYATLAETMNPDEGYQTISELMILQDKLDSFKTQIVARLRVTSSNENECKISALVPLVEESHAIYVFLVSMMRAMHRRVGSIEALEPLRNDFDRQHHMLRHFYFECSNMPYLTSLISIPQLLADPPRLYDADDDAPPPAPPAERQEVESDGEDTTDNSRAIVPAGNSAQPDWLQTQLQQAQMIMQTQRERIAMLEQQAQQLAGAGDQQLSQYRGQLERDQLMLQNYDRRVKQLEEQLGQMHLMNQSASSKDDMIRQLQAELAKLKERYEKLSKLYAELRTEHLSMLERMKELRKRAQGAANSEEELKRLQNTLKSKQSEIMSMMRDRDKYKNELDRIQDSYNENVGRLRRDLEHTKDKLDHLSRSKGAETSELMRKFNQEKGEFETLAKSKEDLADRLRRELEDLRSECDAQKVEYDSKVAVLEAGMDQALLALQQQRNENQEGEESLAKRQRDLEGDHAQQLDMILDSILADCASKVDESQFLLDTGTGAGNVDATPEFVLSVIEQTSGASENFASGFKEFLGPGGDQTRAITRAYSFANQVGQLLVNLKGLTRLAEDDAVFGDKLVGAAKSCARSSKIFFVDMQSQNLGMLAHHQRPGHVDRHNSTVQNYLSEAAGLAEKLVISSNALARNPAADLADAVEDEMRNAAKAIEDATKRLQEVIQNRPEQEDQWTFKVHGSILDSSMAVMTAIARLIRRATETQQEIVSQGRGDMSKTQFYKKNNRWTEGLISAAKAVAVTAQMLVETADGVVHETHKIEQLVVAAHEVAGATAQLVAASRVKAAFGSKTQEKLEQAAKDVSAATKLLVEAAQAVAKRKQKDKQSVNFREFSLHDLKVAEMEKKVKILELEQQLTMERSQLSELRRVTYHQ